MKIIETQTTESLRLKALFAQSKISKQTKKWRNVFSADLFTTTPNRSFFLFQWTDTIYFDSLTGKLSTKPS